MLDWEIVFFCHPDDWQPNNQQQRTLRPRGISSKHGDEYAMLCTVAWRRQQDLLTCRQPVKRCKPWAGSRPEFWDSTSKEWWRRRQVQAGTGPRSRGNTGTCLLDVPASTTTVRKSRPTCFPAIGRSSPTEKRPNTYLAPQVAYRCCSGALHHRQRRRAAYRL